MNFCIINNIKNNKKEGYTKSCTTFVQRKVVKGNGIECRRIQNIQIQRTRRKNGRHDFAISRTFFKQKQKKNLYREEEKDTRNGQTEKRMCACAFTQNDRKFNTYVIYGQATRESKN